jgi:hypothetical protein
MSLKCLIVQVLESLSQPLNFVSPSSPVLLPLYETQDLFVREKFHFASDIFLLHIQKVYQKADVYGIAVDAGSLLYILYIFEHLLIGDLLPLIGTRIP